MLIKDKVLENLYKEIGFKMISDTIPNYYWIVNDRREYRFK
jgi:hypothetical protein